MSAEIPSSRVKEKRTLQRKQTTIQEIQYMACNYSDCIDKPSGLLNLQISHALFRHLLCVTCRGPIRQLKLAFFETQVLYQFIHQVLEAHTDDIADQGSWRKLPSRLQMCSNFFPSYRHSTSGLRGHHEF